jgi:hypothetical protein
MLRAAIGVGVERSNADAVLSGGASNPSRTVMTPLANATSCTVIVSNIQRNLAPIRNKNRVQ